MEVVSRVDYLGEDFEVVKDDDRYFVSINNGDPDTWDYLTADEALAEARQIIDDRRAETYRVALWRMTKAGQWTYFTSNPAGGGFGMNTSDASLKRGIGRATETLKPGQRYRLVVNGEDRGVFTKGG